METLPFLPFFLANGWSRGRRSGKIRGSTLTPCFLVKAVPIPLESYFRQYFFPLEGKGMRGIAGRSSAELFISSEQHRGFYFIGNNLGAFRTRDATFGVRILGIPIRAFRLDPRSVRNSNTIVCNTQQVCVNERPAPRSINIYTFYTVESRNSNAVPTTSVNGHTSLHSSSFRSTIRGGRLDALSTCGETALRIPEGAVFFLLS